MDKIIRISDLSGIFSAGVRNFVESLLKSKAEENDTVAYSVNGQIVTLKAQDALWIYEKLSKGLKEWEVNLLTDVAARGEDMHYRLQDGQVLVIPAKLVLDLFKRMEQS